MDIEDIISNEEDLERLLSLSTNSCKSFTYFKKRPLCVIKNHLISRIFFHNGKLIGYSHVENDNNKNWFGILICDEHVGKGYGSKILKKILDYAKNNNLNEIFLSVYNDNFMAIKLYEKFGFRIVEQHENYKIMKLEIKNG